MAKPNTVRLYFSKKTKQIKKQDVPEGAIVTQLSNGIVVDENNKPFPVVDEEKKYRDIEISMLSELAQLSYSTAKTIKDCNICRDIYETIENITDKEDCIDLDKRDIETLVKTFEEIPKGEVQRPRIWLVYCGEMITQLDEKKIHKGGEDENRG